MIEMHASPSTLQSMIMTCAKSASGGIQDMRTVASAVFSVRGPDGAATTTYSATISAQTSAGLTLTHVFTSGELAAPGVYNVWPIFTLSGGATIQGEPQNFRVKERWERLNN